jgi:hypothetical protein
VLWVRIRGSLSEESQKGRKLSCTRLDSFGVPQTPWSLSSRVLGVSMCLCGKNPSLLL